LTEIENITNIPNLSFGKEYKLCSRKVIEELFTKGKTVKNYPLRLVFMEHPLKLQKEVKFQIVISVPKKNFKKAHDRNRIKRLLKEAIRLNKSSLEQKLTEKQMNLALFMIYSDQQELSLDLIQKKIIKLFEQLINQVDHA
jgi:ribonuclease P protein component